MCGQRKWAVVARLLLAVLIVAGAGVTPAVAGDPTHQNSDATRTATEALDVGAAANGTEANGTEANGTGANGSTATVSVSVQHDYYNNNTVASERVRNDGAILTSDDPTLTVSVAAATRIRLIAVRIDGRTYRSYVPNATATNQSITLNVGAGQHDIKTVVRTEDRTRTHTFVLTEDPSPPRVEFRAPFTTEIDGTGPEGVPNAVRSGRLGGWISNGTGPGSVPDEIAVDSSRVRLAGNIVDLSNVAQVEIERESYYRGGLSGNVRYDQNRIVLTDVNGSFSQPIELIHTEDEPIPESPTGESTNYIELSVRDQLGHRMTYELNIVVNDNDGPTITVTDTDIQHGNATATVTYAVTDDIGIRAAGVADEPLVPRSLFKPDPMNQPRQATFTHTFPVDNSPEVVRFTATDAGQTTTTVEREFDRDELIDPQISFDTNRTVVVRRGTVRVVGTVAEGAIGRVRVETVAPDGRVLDIKTVHAGQVVQTVNVNETLRTSTYPARVRTRVVDARGKEHVRSVTISVPPRDPTPNATDTTPSPAPTATDTGADGIPGLGDGSPGLETLSRVPATLGGVLADHLLIWTILLLAGVAILRT